MFSHSSRNDRASWEKAALLRGFLCLVLILPLAACAMLLPGPVIQPRGFAPLSATVDSVPFFAQRKYQCGPAALAMVLQWSGIEITPDELVPVVYTPGRKGSLQSGLVTAARRYERLAYPIEGMDCLIREVAAQRPVVVLQNLGLSWLPRWHYAVVIGYDLNKQSVILHSGRSAAREVGLKAFLRTWHRAGQWGLLALTPGSMPACAQESTYLRAALGLQQAGHPKAALKTFSAAVTRWPDSVEACLALGNAFYEDGSPSEAFQAFSHALRIEPSNGPALNNLAHLLAESGDLDSAEDMARRAVAVGGIHMQTYRRTLEEILLQKRAR